MLAINDNQEIVSMNLNRYHAKGYREISFYRERKEEKEISNICIFFHP